MNAAAPSPAILIVDDANSLRAMLRAIFNAAGYRVVGELARCAGVGEAVEQHKPDIVCLDHELPDGKGLDLLKSLHANHPETAVVMISGDASAELEPAAAEAGAAGFLRKPFSQETIEREIRQVLFVRKLQRAAQGAQPFAVKAARARAVVVDDSTSMRKLLAVLLGHAGVEVVGEAADGQQAIAVVARCRPDIVCLDVDMPVMNGLDALAQIHRDQPQAQVMMITARADREMVRSAAERGARGYILKPFVPDKVIAAIDQLLAD